MKKLLLTLAAGAALTIGLAGHSAPASALPSAGARDCQAVPIVKLAPWVDVDGDGQQPLIDPCPS